jgi:hypothetical protein
MDLLWPPAAEFVSKTPRGFELSKSHTNGHCRYLTKARWFSSAPAVFFTDFIWYEPDGSFHEVGGLEVEVLGAEIPGH